MVENSVFIQGLWVPEQDEQLAAGLLEDVKSRKRPVISGRVAWRYDRIKSALGFIPVDRRRVAIDIGAHIGLWTRWLAKDFQMVHAFEPVRHHHYCLAANLISTYGDVEIYPVALGDVRGRVEMVIDTKSSGRSHVQFSDNEVTSYEVPLLTLDHYEFTDVDFLKIDVEGFERRVLVGAEKTIRDNKPVIVIEQLGHEERYGDKPYAALELLKGWGAVELRKNMKGDYYLGWKNG